ncbi:MAG: PH domain-containing protein [Candidatus Bathyarchaeia archaeon]|nr:PH domain-containing protein [Candidatus Bathyarchaeota archaeon]
MAGQENLSELPKSMLGILRRDERILWYGKPVFGSFVLHLGNMWGFVFVGFFIIVGIIGAFSIIPPTNMPYGFGFIVAFQTIIGLLMLFGPIFRNALAYNNTFYLITDRRVLIQTGAVGIDTRIIEFDRIQEIYVTVDFVDKIFGTGGIKISTAAGWPEQAYVPTLIALNNPYQIHDILQNAMEKNWRAK